MGGVVPGTGDGLRCSSQLDSYPHFVSHIYLNMIVRNCKTSVMQDIVTEFLDIDEDFGTLTVVVKVNKPEFIPDTVAHLIFS